MEARRRIAARRGGPDRIATQIELALLLDGQFVVKFTKQQTDAAPDLS